MECCYNDIEVVMEKRNAIVEFLSYALEENEEKVEILIDKENNTLWATQKAIAELYGCI